jgi:hypothetical protein
MIENGLKNPLDQHRYSSVVTMSQEHSLIKLTYLDP